MAEFPRQKLIDFLTSWYDQQLKSALRAPKTPEELLKEGGTVFDIQPELSSTKAVQVLLRLEDILGFEPTKKVIKRGGYRSGAEFVRDMMANLERAFTTRQKPVLSLKPKEASASAKL